jgi:hypothetical protein
VRELLLLLLAGQLLHPRTVPLQALQVCGACAASEQAVCHSVSVPAARVRHRPCWRRLAAPERAHARAWLLLTSDERLQQDRVWQLRL